MRFIILGGGCYGSFYTQQLLRARAAGAVVFDEIVVVDHNERPPAMADQDVEHGVTHVRAEWDDFFDHSLRDLPTSSPDEFVPSPFNPHLGLAWLQRRLNRELPDIQTTLEPFRDLPGIPFQEQRDHGTLLLSHADWICPVHCIEPEICPKTRSLRDWDMDVTAHRFASRLAEAGQAIDQIHMFHCHHRVYGVGAYPVAGIAAAGRDVLEAVQSNPNQRFLIGTISRCHGAMHLLVTRAGTDSVSPRPRGHSIPSPVLIP